LARLLLHIGAHKTATSYVQRLFHLNRDILKEHGIIYPDVGKNPGHHILVTPWIAVPEIPKSTYGKSSFCQRLLRKNLSDAFFDRLVKKHARQEGTVFISAEIFSRAEPQRVDMQDLARRLSPFEDVKIVYTVRHQIDYIQSIWLQVAKNGRAPRFNQFLDHAIQKKLASGLWVEHGKVIDHVLTGFSADKLIILDYESIRRHPEGTAGIFLDLMNASLRFKDLKDIDRREANISPDPLASLLAHSICWPSPMKPNLMRKLQPPIEKIREQHAKNRTTLYTREEYKRVDEAFLRDNADLSKWLQIERANAKVTVPASTETLLFREDLTVSDWEILAYEAEIPDWTILAHKAGVYSGTPSQFL
jgi:hypothetical protein